MTPQLADITSSFNFFKVALFLFSGSVTWSKFHANVITGFRVMTIFVYKGLNRNPEIRNTPV